MMRSLFSGISGLRNHQTRMDVIGNNIANVNTAGFKSSRVIFQDIFSQNIAAGMANTGAAGAGAGGQGGTNPVQVGLGISLSAIDVIHTRSAFQRTDRPTDMMINGDGFFVVRGPDGDFFTRAGNFSIDDEGFLVTSQGFFVMGYPVDLEMGVVTHGNPEIPPIPNSGQATSWSDPANWPTGADAPPAGTLSVIPAAIDGTPTMIPADFFNTGDIVPAGTFTVNGQPWPENDLTVRADSPPTPSMALELAQDLPMRRRIGIGALQPAERAVPPRFGLIPVSEPNTATLAPIRVLRPDQPLVPLPLGYEVLDQLVWMENEEGNLVLDFENMRPPAPGANDPAAPPIPVPAGMSAMEFWLSQFPTGDMHLPNFNIANNGEISVLSGGRNVVIAQVAVAMFSNPAGLEVAGNNLYRETASSGAVVMGQAGFDGAGAINGGGLEMSNVDMADQFTDMIVTQRGFQANSRIITVTDSMLEELVNLKR